MATFDEHLGQARSNIGMLEHLSSQGVYIDWQITVCFYVAVHLANAHIAKREGKNFRAHVDVSDSLNPYNNYSSKIDTKTFAAFQRLHGLSRKARYLVSPTPIQGSGVTPACYATPRHLVQALEALDKVIGGFKDIHRFALPKIKIVYSQWPGAQLKHILITPSKTT